MSLGAGASPKRKSKPMLTLIPEEERAINHRLTIVLVGEGAKEFALCAVNSEMAEAFRPKKREKPSRADSENDVSFVGKTPSGLDSAQGDSPPGAENDGDEAPRVSQSAKSEGSLQSAGTGGGGFLGVDRSEGLPRKSEAEKSNREEREEDSMIIFCPTGENTKELARLRLHTCEKFSESLPLQRDKAVASNMIVVFLFWRVDKRETSATAGTISDWYSRMAEINHMPAQFRPNTVILPFETDDEQDQKLKEFVDKQAGKVFIPPVPVEDNEDSIMEALQELAEDHIKHHRGHRPDSKTHPTGGGSRPEASGGGSMSQCCSMM